MKHNEGHSVLTREDRISIQSAENTEVGLTWIFDNWLPVAIVIIIMLGIGKACGMKIK